MHRLLPEPRAGRTASEGGRQARADLGPGEERQRDDRLRRQPRHADEGRRHRLERQLHHQLPRPNRQGAAPHGGDRARFHDHDPQLHQRPAHARPDAFRHAPRARRGAEHDPDHDRCGARGRPGPARFERQARRQLGPCADGQCQPRRSGLHAQSRHQRRGTERRVESGGGRRAEGRARLYRPAAGLERLQPSTRQLHGGQPGNQRDGRQARPRRQLVRQ